MSWHDWQTLLAESLMDGSSTLQLMHAPGSSVKCSGTRSWQVLQICGREGGGCMVGGGSWKLAPGLMMKLLFSCLVIVMCLDSAKVNMSSRAQRFLL